MVFYLVSPKYVRSMVPAVFLMLPHATLQPLQRRGQSAQPWFVDPNTGVQGEMIRQRVDGRAGRAVWLQSLCSLPNTSSLRGRWEVLVLDAWCLSVPPARGESGGCRTHLSEALSGSLQKEGAGDHSGQQRSAIVQSQQWFGAEMCVPSYTAHRWERSQTPATSHFVWVRQ